MEFMNWFGSIHMSLLPCAARVVLMGDCGRTDRRKYQIVKLRGMPLRLFLVALAVALVGAACGSDDDNGGDGGSDVAEGVSGTVTVSGSSTVEPISAANAEKFAGVNPDVNITVEGPGTGDGFALFCNGETDVSDASRPIDPEEEIPACEKNGIEYIELKVGIDGLTVMTNPANESVECLSFKDLYALLGPESDGFESWSDANGLAEEIGAEHAPYPDAPLDVTAPGEESGTYDSFAELVLEDIAVEERKQSEDGPFVRSDYQASANDNVIIQGIEGSESSLGWVGFAYFAQNTDGVRAIPIAEEGDDCVEPTTETISSGDYPIARDLYIYVNKANAEENAALKAYIDFYMSDEGFTSVNQVGYVDLPSETIEETRSIWESMETGTREG